MSAYIDKSFLKDLNEYIEKSPKIAKKAASLTLNQMIKRKGLTVMRRKIEEQVNFPKGYLNQPKRLWVSKTATPDNLSATLSGRSRNTSLARFASGNTPRQRKAGVVVKVKKRGTSKFLRRAFLMKLANDNIGLAIRLPKGKKPKNAYKPQLVRKGSKGKTDLWLLSGPSIDQLVKSIGTQDVIPGISANIEQEFLRQFTRLHG